MRRLLLTSAGFENPKLAQFVMSKLAMEAKDVRVLFIPVAAISDDEKSVVHLCFQELIQLGIVAENIVTYKADYRMSAQEINMYHLIYVCGGNTRYLYDKLNYCKLPLCDFYEGSGIYVGVSAASIIHGNNLENNLGTLDCKIHVHQSSGTEAGSLNVEKEKAIFLRDDQGLYIEGDSFRIIE